MSDSIIGLAYFAVIGANIILSLVVLYRGFLNRTNVTFSLMSLLLAVWVAASYSSQLFVPVNMDIASFWFRMRYWAIFPIPAIFLYFSIIFPENRNPGARAYLIFVPTVLLYLMQTYGLIARHLIMLPDGVTAKPYYGPFIVSFAVYYLVYFVLTFAIMAAKYNRLRGISRLQIRYVAIGGLIPVIIGGLGNFFLPLAGIDPGALAVFGPLSTVFISYMISSAIVKHRLLLLPTPFLGLNNLLGRGLVYTVIASFIAAVYFGFLFIAARSFQEISGNHSILIGFVFFISFAVIFGPLKDRLQYLVNAFLFKSRLDYEKTLRQTSMAVNFIYNRERLIALITKLITKRMGLSGAAFYIYDESVDSYVIKGAGGICKAMIGNQMKSENPIVQRIEETKSLILKSDVERDLSDVFLSDYEKDKLRSVLKEMSDLNIQLCFPSVLRGRVIAFLAMGGKILGDYFSEEDFVFLRALSAQNSMFLENFILAEKEKASARSLAESQARDKYTKMLENLNNELVNTREELVKSERMATLTMLSVTLQMEINNPLSEIIQKAHEVSSLSKGCEVPDKPSIVRSIESIETNSKKIRELLRNLASIIDPVMKEYKI